MKVASRQDLLNRIEQLEQLLQGALVRIERSEAEVERLRAENKALRAENAELRAKLGQNSRNSSRPPSSDGPGATPRKQGPTGRARGGQAGRPGAERRRLEPTTVVDHWPERCGRCDGRLAEGVSTSEAKWAQVVEIPEIRPLVTEHRAHASTCACGAVTEAALPDSVLAHGFGPRASAFVAYLTGRFRLSKRQVVELCEEAFGVPVALGSVCALEQEVSTVLARPVEEAREAVRTQSVVHMDETGWREDKKRAWLWTAVTSAAVVFQISPSRGQVVARDMLGPRFGGSLVTDRWSAYNWVETARRQLCWAHLLRDFAGMKDRGGIGGGLAAQMLDHTSKMMEWWGQVRDGTMPRSAFQSNMVIVRTEVPRLLREASVRAEKKTAGMCAEILKLESALWTFVDTAGIDPTNNAAERAVRPAVLWRKGSFGTDSASGSRFVERILTTVATLRLHGRNVLSFLTRACADLRNSRPTVSLLAPVAPSNG
jgi:transposase